MILPKDNIAVDALISSFRKNNDEMTKQTLEPAPAAPSWGIIDV